MAGLNIKSILSAITIIFQNLASRGQ